MNEGDTTDGYVSPREELNYLQLYKINETSGTRYLIFLSSLDRSVSRWLDMFYPGYRVDEASVWLLSIKEKNKDYVVQVSKCMATVTLHLIRSRLINNLPIVVKT